MSRDFKRAIFAGAFTGILVYTSLKIGIELPRLGSSIFVGIISAMGLALSWKLFK